MIKIKRGERIDTHVDIMRHPDGSHHSLPVITVGGKKEGPTLLISANIHGNEITGIPVIHELLREVSTDQLQGDLILLPTLSPGGLRTCERYPYYDKRDPNRLFPDFRKVSKTFTDHIEELNMQEHLSLQEWTNKKVYELVANHADVYMDLHCAPTHSAPLVYVDPLFYKDDKEEAEKLFNRTLDLAKQLDLTIVTDTAGREYFERHMHRTSTGSILNGLRKPALTVELGSKQRLEEAIVPEAVKGIKNIMKKLGMLQGEKEACTHRIRLPDGLYRFIAHPNAKHAGIIRFATKEGESIKQGDAVAHITDIFGKKVGEGKIASEIEGYVMWINPKHAVYPNDVLGMMAVPFTPGPNLGTLPE